MHFSRCTCVPARPTDARLQSWGHAVLHAAEQSSTSAAHSLFMHVLQIHESCQYSIKLGLALPQSINDSQRAM